MPASKTVSKTTGGAAQPRCTFLWEGTERVEGLQQAACAFNVVLAAL